jgi:non-canonical (house-cleaning) NTP pyrophosphatase
VGPKLESDRLDKITNAVASGFLQGETVEQIVKRVAGTPQLNREDGVINASS